MDIKEVLTYAYENKIKIDKFIDYVKTHARNPDGIINDLDNMRKNYERNGSSESEYIKLSDQVNIDQELNYCKLYRNKCIYDTQINKFIALLEDFISKSISIE